jgi:hypothetical protein
MFRFNKIFFSLIALSFVVTSSASAKDYISIVSSSTVFPFATFVAVSIASVSMGAPVIVSTRSSSRPPLFCAHVSVGHPDITYSSRAQSD